ncbi:hypothetical protein DV737_g4372, partial [Chaetothyriales sp. CBS 132003]
MAQVPHIPAWKRLGLKLKYAQEDVSESVPASATNKASGKAKADGANGTTKSKNRHLNGHSSPPLTSNGSMPHINGHNDGSPPAKKQKRVSFSADTKLLDGDGDGVSTARHAIPSELANASSLDNKSQNMLDYLHQYYNEHSSWKFQKNREVWILKHALSTEDIPTKDYGLALAQYVYGLKSEGARKRLGEEAKEKLLLTSTTETGEQESSTEDQGEQLKRLRETLVSFPENTTSLSDDESHHHHPALATLSRPLLILTALYPHGDDSATARRANSTAATAVENMEMKTQTEASSLPSKPASAETARNKKRKNRTTLE